MSYIPTEVELRDQRIALEEKYFRCEECGVRWGRRPGPGSHLCPNRCNGYFSRHALRERGWRPCEIKRLEPDLLIPNPHFRAKGAPMRLYYRRRIIALEGVGRREPEARTE